MTRPREACARQDPRSAAARDWKAMDAVVKSFARPVGAEPAQAARRPTREEAEEAVRTLIRWAGDDPAREGLRDTPRRVVKAYGEMFGGYAGRAEDHLDRTFEEVAGYDGIVLLRDIPFHSHCEHHMAPFFGVAHVGYYPSGGVVGLSKLGRVIDLFARRLQTQEALTAQIADAIEGALAPRGLAVMLEAEHLCMSMRGVLKPGVKTLTVRFRGLLEDPAEQARFVAMARGAAPA